MPDLLPVPKSPDSRSISDIGDVISMEGQLKEKTVLQTAENTPQPQSEYDEVRAMLHGLLNDHDGSFARKVLAENQDKVAAFEAKVQQEQDRWQLAQELENSADKINFGGRSFG